MAIPRFTQTITRHKNGPTIVRHEHAGWVIESCWPRYLGWGITDHAGKSHGCVSTAAEAKGIAAFYIDKEARTA